VLGCLLAHAFSLKSTGTAFALLDSHLYGHVLQEASLPFEGEADLVALGAELLGPEVRAAYPYFTRFATERALQPGYSFGDEFEVGLDLVLDAVERMRAPASEAGLRSDSAATRSRPASLEVSVPVLGVDGCAGGWVGAVLVPGAPRPRVVVAPTIAKLVETVRADVGVQVVGIDIPIGLPDSTRRQADVLARRALPGRASSVFTTLTRPAYLAATRAEADAVNRGLSGQGVGAHAFALRDKIVEVDTWVRGRPTVHVVEVHPEVSFTTMTGTALPGKRTAQGQAARLEALAGAGVARPSVLAGSGYSPDDVLDACAAAWSAHRCATGDAHSLPDPPEVFSDGIPAAILV